MNLAINSEDQSDAKLDSKQMHLWAPAVDGILRRFNADATRTEAALSAVYLLQAMKTVGVFTYAPNRTVAGSSEGQFIPAKDGQRPAVRANLANRLEEALKPEPDSFTRT